MQRFWNLRLILLGLLTLLAIWIYRAGPEGVPNSTPQKAADIPTSAMMARSEPLPGEVILKGYGRPTSTVERDLEAVGRAFENLMLLIKGGEPFRMGANEELAAALRGKNRTGLRFLPDDHPAFNEAGQIVDRWGTPLFFHVESASVLDVRSAGPDGEMWTEDDVHRLHSGRFYRGDALPETEDLRMQR